MEKMAERTRFHKRFYRLYESLFPPALYYAKDLHYFDGLDPIIDIGCGHGLFMESAPDRIIGVEHNADSVKICASKGLKCLEGSCLSLPVADRSAGGVYCSHLIEHLNWPEAERLTGEIDRVLTNGGRVVIKSPLFDKNFFDDPTHVKPYPPAAVLNLFGLTSGQQTATLKVKSYRLVAVKWDRKLLYAPLVPPSANPRRHWAGLLLRGATVFLAQFGIRRLQKAGYTIVLEKTA